MQKNELKQLIDAVNEEIDKALFVMLPGQAQHDERFSLMLGIPTAQILVTISIRHLHDVLVNAGWKPGFKIIEGSAQHVYYRMLPIGVIQSEESPVVWPGLYHGCKLVKAATDLLEAAGFNFIVDSGDR